MIFNLKKNHTILHLKQDYKIKRIDQESNITLLNNKQLSHLP